ncbi:MAG: FAD-binding oxidoreductase, partial [Leptospiraceae bacterium]|nr:FAD-binding oxidoreductase [Leptospiraceae bacterium]
MAYYHEIKYDINYAREQQRWNAWGSLDHDFLGRDHMPRILQLIRQELDVTSDLSRTPSISIEDVRLPGIRLKEKELSELHGIVGKSHVRSDDQDRILHSVGQSYFDIIRLRTNTVKHFVDAVAYPLDDKEIHKILSWCEKNKVALVPYGGGSSVVGGVEAIKTGKQKAVISLDLSRLNRPVMLDEYSRLAEFEAGIYGPQLEEFLNRRGFTLGHFPQSFEYSTLGGWVAARSAGQQSNHYGSIHKLVHALRLVTSSGTVQVGGYPSSATGPDLNEFFTGSEGLYGVITSVTVKVHRLPEERRYFGIFFPDFKRGVEFVREVSEEGGELSMVRLSDPAESRLLGLLGQATKSNGIIQKIQNAIQELILKSFGQPEGRCMVIAGIDGDREYANRLEILLRGQIRKYDGFFAGQSPGKRWMRTRFNMPFLRNHIMESNIGVDTLETATTYSRIHELHAAVLEALQSATPHATAMCHLSHSYHDGACLYFTIIFLVDYKDPVAQWKRIKKAASEAVLKHGGTISHHHGVGADHKSWFQQQTDKTVLSGLR